MQYLDEVFPIDLFRDHILFLFFFRGLYLPATKIILVVGNVC